MAALQQIENLLQMVDKCGSELSEEKSGGGGAAVADSLKYKLEYFPFEGRAHAIRLAFYLQGIAFEDSYMSFPQFGAMKKEQDMEWTGLPMLTIYDGKTNGKVDRMGQSNSMLRYVARLPGGASKSLYPVDSPLACFQIDEICDACEDLTTSLVSTFGLDDTGKEVKRKELWAANWSFMFDKFNDKLARNKCNGAKDGAWHFVGDRVTIADLKFYVSIKSWLSGNIDHVDPKLFDQERFKNVKAFHDSMANMPKLKEYKAMFEESCKVWKDSQSKAK